MADEKVMETVTPAYDDAALEAEFMEKRKAQRVRNANGYASL
jgi:hypothetical protein